MTHPHDDGPTMSEVNGGGQDHEPVPRPKHITPRSPLAVFDIETTGLYDGALIHEIAVWSTRDGPWETKIVYSDEVLRSHRDRHAPWCPLSGNRDPNIPKSGRCNACDFRAAQKITGYPDNGWDDGMSPKDARDCLYKSLDGHALVAHNGFSFDFPRIRAFLWPYELRGLCVDTMHMYRLLFPKGCGISGYSLDKLSEYLGLEPEGQHLAMSGVMQLSKVTKRVRTLIDKGLKYEAIDNP